MADGVVVHVVGVVQVGVGWAVCEGMVGVHFSSFVFFSLHLPGVIGCVAFRGFDFD